MMPERQVQELVARCVSSLVFYVNSGQTRQAQDARAADARAAARLVTRWGMSDRDTAEALLRPVEAEMVARYGRAEGRRLSGEFAATFTRSAGADPVGVGGDAGADGPATAMVGVS